jgi:hypothetical protein
LPAFDLAFKARVERCGRLVTGFVCGMPESLAAEQATILSDQIADAEVATDLLYFPDFPATAEPQRRWIAFI